MAAQLLITRLTINEWKKRLISEKPVSFTALLLRTGEKEEQRKPKISGRKEIIKIRAEISEMETNQTIAKINKTKGCCFKKINKIGNPLASLIKKRRASTQIKKIRIEKGEITTDTAEIQKIVGDYYKQQSKQSKSTGRKE